MGVMMELHQGECFWPATREVAREGGGDDKEGDGEGGNEGVGGFAEVYRNMSADQRANWMYDHTVRQFQYVSTRDNLEPHLQIDPFLGFEADYPPLTGYQGSLSHSYTYRPLPPQDGSS
ncbi:hypothetical protein Tco_0083900 [Tanacetum coccineum]